MLPAHPRITLLHPANALSDVTGPVYLEQNGQNGVMIKTHRALVIDRAFRIALRGITGLAVGLGIGLAAQLLPTKPQTTKPHDPKPHLVRPMTDKYAPGKRPLK